MTETTTALVPTSGIVALSLIDELGVTLSSDGLRIREGAELPTRETWETIGRALSFVDDAARWWVGDWLNWGTELFGDEAYDAAEPTTADRYEVARRITSYEPQTLINISNVCAKVARARRRTPPLGFWIHQAVASLDPDEQTEWLDEAIEAGMTEKALRAAIKEAKGGGGADPDADSPRQYLTPEEILHNAAVLVANQMQPNGDGTYTIPGDAATQLLVALGREPS